VTRYTADSRDRVRDAVDMLALVESRVELRRTGSNSYFGRCPFHDERTPSFHVRPEEKHYHCFGCAESGDPFDFVMQTEGLDFKGALEALAERFGVRLQSEEEDPEAERRRARQERLLSLLRRAAAFYERYLWQADEAAAAREYLRGRGFSEETLREFGVGFAPTGWERMIGASRSSGHTDEELLAAGLALRSRRDPSRLHDRFRGRIMFPTADSRGRIRGFGARAISAGSQPKYLNTSESELYRKREVLYGIHLARSAAARAGRVVLVEGYTDVIALHQAGVSNAVGIMGTSLTREQLAELVRLCGRLELCLDADAAGQEAMARAAALCADQQVELRVVPLPPGSDPGELIAREGADGLRERIAASVPYVVFAVQRILAGAELSSAEGKDRAIAELRGPLGGLGTSVLRDELVHQVAGALAIGEARLVSLLGSAPNGARRDRGPLAPDPGETSRGPDGGRGGITRAAAGGSGSPLDRTIVSERAFLAMCLAAPGPGADALAALEVEAMLTSAVLRRAARHLAANLDSPLANLPPQDEELARVIADLVQRAGRRSGDRPVSAEELEHARLLLDLARVERELIRLRAGGGGGVTGLARERQAIRDSIDRVLARQERLS
jgi:DNA primase